MITTEAWVLYEGQTEVPERAELKKEAFTFSDITPEEVLVEPIYGCWEANMTHAIERKPIDLCKHRREEKVVLGNAGTVRVLKTGSAVTTVKEGQLCVLYSDILNDKHGYPLKIMAYDAPNTIGVLAKQTKVPPHCLIPFPEDTSFSAKEWAAFSVRYITAWDNWRVAYGCWRVQMPDVDPSEIHVWAWGGGVSLAQLALAKSVGCQTAMTASSDIRLQLIEQMGIRPIDRRTFADLSYKPQRYKSDPAYRARYIEAEQHFFALVKEHTQGEGVSIFIDNIGLPVFRATTKALARQGVIATSGWKHGMRLSILRAVESINRHTHVHTHGSRTSEAIKAVQVAEKLGWRPPVAKDRVYKWDEIPQLTEDYEAGRIDSYFPLFEVNTL
jgi:NADPH:quinone reductase-like Zn-dependent oxidoreductase